MRLRTALALIISIAILIVHDTLWPPPRPELEDSKVELPVESSEDSGAEPSPEPAANPQQFDAQPIETHRLGSADLSLQLTNAASGPLESAELLGQRFLDEDGSGLRLLTRGSEGAPAIGLRFVGDGVQLENAAKVEKADGSLWKTRVEQPRLRLEQQWELHENSAHWTIEVTNPSNQAATHQLELSARMALSEDSSRFDIHRTLCAGAEELEDFDQSDLEDGALSAEGRPRWMGVDSKYFVAALLPQGDGFELCRASSDEREMVGVLRGATRTLGAGETATYELDVFVGAKELDRLQQFEGLEDAIDWGWFGSLSSLLGKRMLDLLRFFKELTGVWGFAIVLITVVVKGVTLPLTIKQYRSMRKMREVQPQLTEIREKYANDRQKQAQEQQALFQREGVNPLSGCLPMLVQLPVWFALYAMLGTAVELYHEPFLWLKDLTQPDPYFALPVAMGGMMFLQMRMQPNVGDPVQAKMMQVVMPIFMGGMMLFMPSGLCVYIFANFVLSLIQTWVQLRPDRAAAKVAST